MAVYPDLTEISFHKRGIAMRRPEAVYQMTSAHVPGRRRRGLQELPGASSSEGSSALSTTSAKSTCTFTLQSSDSSTIIASTVTFLERPSRDAD
jgi:hypothetical protein